MFRSMIYVCGFVSFPSYDRLVAVEQLGRPRLRDASRSRHAHAESAVPRYFIDTNDDDLFVVDDEGLDLLDAQAARKAAQAALADMAREKLPDGTIVPSAPTFATRLGDNLPGNPDTSSLWRVDKPAS